jgi:hypothetical protein
MRAIRKANFAQLDFHDRLGGYPPIGLAALTVIDLVGIISLDIEDSPIATDRRLVAPLVRDDPHPVANINRAATGTSGAPGGRLG